MVCFCYYSLVCLLTGPLPKTFDDFWRMIWEQHCLVIVMTTRVMERGRVKCGQYWEPSENGMMKFNDFIVHTHNIQTHEDYTVASLELRNLKVFIHFISLHSSYYRKIQLMKSYI